MRVPVYAARRRSAIPARGRAVRTLAGMGAEFSLGPFEPVADRVFVAVAEPASVNIGLVVGSSGALVVDTGSSPAQGRAILAAARALAGDVPVTHVVITHHHYDHLFGLGGFEGVTSLGQAGLDDDLAAYAGLDDDLAAVGLTRADVVLPGQRFHRAAVVGLGDARAEVMHFGPGHTASDAVVILPERGVAFVGDLLETGARPSVGSDSHLYEWGPTLDWTLGSLTPATVIVPGHGVPLDRNDAYLQRGELSWLYRRIEGLYLRGVKEQFAYDEVQDWLWEEDVVRALIPHVYAQLRAAGLVPQRTRHLPLTPL